MGSLDSELLNQIIQFNVDLSRFDAGIRASVLDILTRMQRELVATLSQGTITEFNKARTAELLRQVTAVLNKYYSTAQGELALGTSSVAQITASHTVDSLNTVIAVNIGASLPTETVLARIAANVLIEGGPVASWWQRLAGDTSFKISNAIRQGIVQGEANQTIISRIIGKNGQPGIMAMARHNAAAVVQTTVSSIANDARLATFRQNSDIINGVRFSSTLDGHTCERCGTADGLWWDLDGNGMDGNTLPFLNPPLHFNCRCALTSVLKPLSEISGGTLPDIPNNGTRASTDGQVPATTTFADWFAGRTAAQQDEQFGPGRAQLYRDGKLSLRDMIDQSGNPLTLDQLKAKYK